MAGVQLCALFPFRLLATWMVVAFRTQPLSGPSLRRSVGPLGIPDASLFGLLTVPVRYQKGKQRHVD